MQKAAPRDGSGEDVKPVWSKGWADEPAPYLVYGAVFGLVISIPRALICGEGLLTCTLQQIPTLLLCTLVGTVAYGAVRIVRHHRRRPELPALPQRMTKQDKKLLTR